MVSTVSRQFFLFEQANIRALRSLGYDVHAAANYADANPRLDEIDITRHHFDIQRSPFSPRNISAYWQLRSIIKSHDFAAIHCHSPVGGVLARVCARRLHLKPVIYTAHGFHFYRGAPVINWLIYYPIERLLARHTDLLITLNSEDFARATAFKTNAVALVPGIGVDITKMSAARAHRLRDRSDLGVSENSILIVSVGELSPRKNHEATLRAFAQVSSGLDVQLAICGQGSHESSLRALTHRLGIESNVTFLGYVDEIPRILSAADIYISTSRQEGLPVSIIEAMACGLPIVCSNIRGSKELVEHEVNGFLCETFDISAFSTALRRLSGDATLRQRMASASVSRATVYSAPIVEQAMKQQYRAALKADPESCAINLDGTSIT
jgi:glycosyltransferase involved in cell wall biosynthesis